MYLYMIICILGSGGREHAICKTISLSSKISKIYCIPGNAGTQQLAENIDLDINKDEDSKQLNYKDLDNKHRNNDDGRDLDALKLNENDKLESTSDNKDGGE